MKKILLDFLLYIYNNVKPSTTIKLYIKRLLRNDKILIRFNGFSMSVGVKSAIEQNILFNTYNEKAVLSIIKKFAQDGYDLVDVGANVGIHSLTAASANAKIEIFSFEPEPSNFNDFIKNISLNNFKNINPFNMGLGNFKGLAELNVNEGWNKGKHSLKVSFSENNKKASILVSLLDDFRVFITSKKIMIKIDVEGFEKEVIEGAKELLNQVEEAVIIIELLAEINGRETCETIINMLIANDFKTIFKINAQNELVVVNQYDGSADYVLLKGSNALKIIT
jgi:FkbM family methyltransferase